MNYKDEALESLRGKWGWSVVLVLEYFAIYYIPSILIDIAVESAGYTGNASIGNLWFIPMTPVAWGVTIAIRYRFPIPHSLLECHPCPFL